MTEKIDAGYFKAVVSNKQTILHSRVWTNKAYWFNIVVVEEQIILVRKGHLKKSSMERGQWREGILRKHMIKFRLGAVFEVTSNERN